MRLRYACPSCQEQLQADVSAPAELRCHCDWSRPVTADLFDGDTPTQCLVCSCGDLWRQKDIPQVLGLAMVGIQIVLSTIAWAMYEPTYWLGILLFFALLDMVLYAVMGDMLVCYRCRARHRKMPIADEHPAFDLEVAERYRQQDLRLKQQPKPTS